MICEVPALTARQNLGELLNEIRHRGDPVVITKNEQPVAALVDIELFERLCFLDEEYLGLRGELAQAFYRVPPDAGTVVIDEAVHAARG